MLAVTPNAVLAPVFADNHFVDQSVFTGLTQPTTIRFASDGRAFVAEKSGIVKEFDSLADTTPTVVVDLHAEVHDFWDRGLLSLAIDPHFLSGSPYLYLYLVYNAPPGQTAPVWPTTSCPSPPGQTTDGCVVTSELVRLTVDTATNVATPTATDVLIHDWCQQFPSHAGGAMVFDNSGNLMVTGGDGASFSGIDYGQRGGTLPNTTSPVTPANPCGDPPGGVGVAATVPTAEGGSLRAQDVRTSGVGDPTGLAGTIIRVDPATGLGVAGNPLATSTDANNQRLVATGFRNPFRMTSRPGTNELYVGDVGDSTWEEIDLVNPGSAPATPTTLADYGWPCYEGTPQHAGWPGLGLTMCTDLYNQGTAVTPLYAYSHTNANSPTGPCFVGPTMSSAISGLAFYEGASGTSVDYGGSVLKPYQGALFFTDYSRNCIGVLFPDVNGRPDPSTMQQVASNLSHPVDLVTGAGGDLYYVDLDAGIVHRISYHLDPVAQATATPSALLAPGDVTLDASASTTADPQDTITSYSWYTQNQADTSGLPDGTGVTYPWHITTPAVYHVLLKVLTAHNRSATTQIDVDATHAPPVPAIDTPSSSLTWTVGDSINFTGHATDGLGAPIAAAGMSWELVIHHCPAGCHLHFIQTWDGVSSGSFLAPDHEYPSYLELRLTVTDTQGAKATTSVLLQPKTATLTVRSSVPGVTLNVDTTSAPSPTTLTYIKGGLATVSAPPTFSAGGRTYHFVTWSDSVNAVHDVTVASNMTITAVYHADACSAVTATSSSSQWLTDYLGGAGDQSWFRFSLPSTRRVVMTAGSLPVDAKLELRSSCGTILATSDHAGTRFEQITRVLKAGTYRLHVVANSGAVSSSPYAVRFRVLSSGDPVLSSTATRVGSTVLVAGEVMNNRGTTSGRITVTATFLKGSKTVKTLRAFAFANRLSNGGVTAFKISGAVPAYTTMRLSATSASPVSGPSLSITALAFSAGPAGTVLEQGTVKNVGSATARSTAVARIWYGNRGEVLGVGFATVAPTTLAHGKSGTFSVTRPAGLTTLQAWSSQVRAVL